MDPELHDLTASDRDGRRDAIEPEAVDATGFIKYCATDWREEIPTRSRILSATAELFLKHGIAATNVETIARAAAITKPTLHRHFVSKEELLLPCSRAPSSLNARRRTVPAV